MDVTRHMMNGGETGLTLVVSIKFQLGRGRNRAQ